MCIRDSNRASRTIRSRSERYRASRSAAETRPRTLAGDPLTVPLAVPTLSMTLSLIHISRWPPCLPMSSLVVARAAAQLASSPLRSDESRRHYRRAPATCRASPVTSRPLPTCSTPKPRRVLDGGTNTLLPVSYTHLDGQSSMMAVRATRSIRTSGDGGRRSRWCHVLSSPQSRR